MFLDETAATTTMARRYGRSACGQRCRLLVTLGHRRTTTVTAALRTTGLVAISMFEGATNDQRFLGYVANTLVPTLRPGDTVVLHKAVVRRYPDSLVLPGKVSSSHALQAQCRPPSPHTARPLPRPELAGI